MKLFLFFLILLGSVNCKAQKYALLDKTFVQPITYTNTVTSKNKLNGLFPVENNMLPQFIDALEEIENKLSSKKPFGEAKQYKYGCTEFVGRNVSLASETRMDYVLISNIDNEKFFMHLSNPKISNGSNIFFIKTWISYIKSNLKNNKLSNVAK